MNILIVGPSGSGKSKLGDFIRNTIFKLDSNSKIITKDLDREGKPFGEGHNIYNIEVEQRSEDEMETLMSVWDLDKDIIIILANDTVSKWFKDVYES
jgi:ribose 1,5-bisphosphokinase PhnN